jgi:hypothetical protein
LGGQALMVGERRAQRFANTLRKQLVCLEIHERRPQLQSRCQITTRPPLDTRKVSTDCARRIGRNQNRRRSAAEHGCPRLPSQAKLGRGLPEN